MEKVEADMLDGVQAESVHARLGKVPQAPALHFLHYLGFGKIDVREHEVIVIARLVPNEGLPGGVVFHELIDSLLVSPLIPVDAVEMPGRPRKR